MYGKGPILDALVAINRLKDEYGHSFPSLAKAVVTLGADEAEAVLAEPRLQRYSLDSVVSVLGVTSVPARSPLALSTVGHVVRLSQFYGIDIEPVADAYRTLGFIGASLACLESREFGVPLDGIIEHLIDEYGLGADGLNANKGEVISRMRNTITHKGELLPMSGLVMPRGSLSAEDAHRYDQLTGNSARRLFEEMRGDVADYGRASQTPVGPALAFR